MKRRHKNAALVEAATAGALEEQVGLLKNAMSVFSVDEGKAKPVVKAAASLRKSSLRLSY